MPEHALPPVRSAHLTPPIPGRGDNGGRANYHISLRAFNRQMFNPTCLKNRHFDGHIATAKNCGTHWIKYMLSLAIAEKFGLPEPAHIRDDAIVGHTKAPPKYKNIPQIAVTHSHPHYLMRLRLFTYLQLPRFVVLVRDMRAILVSIYEKSRGEHLDKKMHLKDVDFQTYLRGDVTGNTRIEDIWGLILFFNAWGAVHKNNPERVLIVRYEDLAANTLSTLRAVRDHIGLEELSDDSLQRAIEKSSKNEMKKRIDATEDQGDKSVNLVDRDFLKWYSESDMEFLREACRRHLKYDFGYKY